MKNRDDEGEIRQKRFAFLPQEEEEGEETDWTSYWKLQRDTPDEDLDQLRERALQCDECALRETCTQVVFGEGAADSQLMFVGEAPGGDEDREGRPFVGRAGRLLDRIIRACELRREGVYITNVVKCRPPGNRTPYPEERDTCFPFLRSQVRLIRPQIIVALGAAATQSLIHPEAMITRMRGTWQEWAGVPVMPTFHPAALLRDPNKKAPTWEDMRKVMEALKGDE